MANQQIYLQLDGKHPIPYAFEADRFPVPRGSFSILHALEHKKVTSAEAIVYLTLNHGSTWISGETWCFSSPYLSEILGTGMSRSYAQKVLASLEAKDWLQKLAPNPTGNRYKIRSHNCERAMIPYNKDGKPLTFSVPRGAGGPIERCIAGEISWKAALVWIVLKLHSNWKVGEDTSGQTQQETLLALSKRCRMRLQGFQHLIQELEHAGMLQRLTPKSQAAIFQLYPKPFARPASAQRPRKSTKRSWKIETIGEYDTKTDGKYWYSVNFQWRVDRETEAIQIRIPGSQKWRRASDYEISQQMPRAIRETFNQALELDRIRRAVPGVNADERPQEAGEEEDFPFPF